MTEITMTRAILLTILGAVAVSSATGCSISFGSTSQTFDVTGRGNGVNRAEATKAAREDAAEQVRQMGYSDFHLEPNGNTSASTTTGKNQVSMRFRVAAAHARSLGPVKKKHLHDGDSCPVCRHKKTCKCSEPHAHPPVGDSQ